MGAPIYQELLRDCGGDLEVLREVVTRTGPGTGFGGDGLARAAAFRIAELAEGPLDGRVAEVIMTALDCYHPGHDEAVKARGLLRGRHAEAASLARPTLGSDSRNSRVNALLLLREAGAATPEDELRVHARNLTALQTTDRFDAQYLEESLAYIEEASARADWEERKRALGVGRITEVAAFRSSGELSDGVERVIVRAFLPEIGESLLEWAKGDRYVLRPRAYRMIRAAHESRHCAAGLVEGPDEWAYHAANLLLDDYTWQFECFHDAVAFFRAQAGGARAAEARSLLRSAREAIVAFMKEQDRLDLRIRRSNVEANLGALDEAVKALE
jgi:hypothetical protein